MEDRLRKFAALCAAGSFTKAAAELHISQPALSAAVRQLERELGASLIVHGVRPLAITPAGVVAQAAATSLTVTLDNLQVKLAGLSHAKVQVRIGMIDSIAGSVFGDAEILSSFQGSAKLSVMVNNTRSLVQAVERSELDIAFVAGLPAAATPTLQVRHLADEPLVAVCSPAQSSAFSQAAAHRSIPHFISYDQASNTNRLVREALHRHGLSVHPEVYSTSPEVMLRFVLLQQGMAVLPYALVAPYIERGELRLLKLQTLDVIPRSIAVVRRRDKESPAALQRLVRQVRRELEGLSFAAQKATSGLQ